MPEIYPTLTQCAVVATALKVLLIPAYKSTDFEVHRNWLALTHSLPVKQWYYESTSEWTLDYPPFFAYFEWLLSWPASLADSAMLNIENLGYDSWATICFQRGSVMLTEGLLIYAVSRYIDSTPHTQRNSSHATALSILLSPGFVIIDHIHFQYNGFLYGLLILSIVLARHPSAMLSSGVLFAILLCFKHIYLYLAPAYFIYLLRAYCLDTKSIFRPRYQNILRLGSSVVGIFGVAFGPFIYWGQLDQLKARLFPFSRGLCHAYWAPNIWAVYSLADRVLLRMAPHLGLTVKPEALYSVTRGLVGDTAFAVLPEVTKEHCFGLTVTLQLFALSRLWFRPDWETFVGAITLCGYASFLFGWHVHEKAILLVLIPFSLLALKDRRYLSAFKPLAVAGNMSLFPLLFTAAEFPIKTAYTICWLVLFLYSFDRLAPAASRPRVFLLDRFSFLYMALSIPLIVYCSLLHPFAFRGRYEFLPLIFTSSYCALGVVGSWLGLMVVYLTS